MIGFVISQESDVRMIANVDGSLVFWEHAMIQRMVPSPGTESGSQDLDGHDVGSGQANHWVQPLPSRYFQAPL